MAIGDYTNVLQQFYIAYFGRPADPIGLNSAAQALSAAGAPTTTQGLVNAYATNATVRTLVDNFGNSAESAALYGAVTTPDTITNFVTQIYLNVLDRQPDLAGLLYWSNEISSGRLIPSRVALTILDAATRTADAQTVANKLAVANNFTTNLDTVAEINAYSGNVAAGIARDMLSNVDGTTNVAAFQATVLNTIVTIVNGSDPGNAFTLTAGADIVNGTAGDDTINGRLSELASFDSVAGGNGTDTLVLTGTLPSDNQLQPAALLDGAFENTTGVERLILAGGTLAQSANAVLGQFAQRAGLQEVVAGGTGGQAQTIDITGFAGALTITGSGNAEIINVDQNTAGTKTLNLGGGTDIVNVTARAGATAGSTQINFTSGAVGDGVDRNATGGIANPVTIVNDGGNIILNDEGTTIVGTINNQFNVVGLAADGTLDLANQNRGNFQTVILGTAGADTFLTDGRDGNVYINAGGGADRFAIGGTFNAAGAYVVDNTGAVQDVAEAGTRHFAVGGGGDDQFFIASRGTAVVIAGGGNNTVRVADAIGNGVVNINFAPGSTTTSVNTITFDVATGVNNLVLNTATAANNDTLVGGQGRDTLVGTTNQLTAVTAPVAEANRSISGFEAITVSNSLLNDLTTRNIQIGIDTVTLTAANNNARTVTFDSGLNSTLNIGAAQTDTLNVAARGPAGANTSTTDQVTIVNTAAAQASGVATNAYNGQAIQASGVETLVINTNAAGTANTQTISSVTLTPSGTATGTVNFVGSNSVTAGVVTARVVDATGLTGTAGLTASTTAAAAPTGQTNQLTGSANADAITLTAINVPATAAVGSVNLGAGNDRLVLDTVGIQATGNHLANLQAGRFTLAGGEGTDTLVARADTAATLSVANAFNANQSGFEQLSITQAAAPVGTQSVDTIRIDNLGVNKVISAGTVAGTPGLGTPEVVTFTAPALLSGQSLTFTVAGLTTPVIVTAPPAGWTADQTATAINTAFVAGAIGTVNGAFAGAVNGAVVTLTGSSVGNVNPLVVQVTNTAGLAQPGVGIVQGVNPVAAVAEVSTLTLPSTATFVPSNGDGMITFSGNGGASFSFGSGPLGNANGALANAIKVAADSDVDWAAAYTTTVSISGNVVFTRTVAGPSTDVSLSGDAELVGDTLAVTTPGAVAIAGTPEMATVTFTVLNPGQSVTVDGRTVTATMGQLSAIDVSNAFEAGINGSILIQGNGARVEGSLTNYSIALTPGTAQTVFTSNTAANVADLTAPATAAPLPAVPTLNTVDGTAAGTLGAAGLIILQNLEDSGTLEITGAGNGGTHEVRIIDSGLFTDDVFNLELTNSGGGLLDYGTVLVANTETINILTKDTGTGGNTAATKDTVILNAAQATGIFVSGNNGLNLDGASVLGNVRLFDASGIASNGADDTAANLGVTLNLNDLALTGAVTVRGSVGNDEFLSNTAATHSFDLSNGGSDRVDFAATRALNGLDTITGFTGGTVGATTNGDLLNLNGFTGVSAQGVNATGTVGGFGGAFGIFNATAANTVSDLVLTGNNVNAYLVVDGNAALDAANVKSQITGATAQNGEILINDGASAYVLHASSADSSVFNVYRAFDNNASAGVVDAQIELIGVVNLTNTFGNLVAGNIA